MDVLPKNPEARRPSADTNEALALQLGSVLAEHKGGNVAVLDLRSLAMWTDFFIIATVTSGAHRAGLKRRTKDFARDHQLDILNSRRKGARDDAWDLIDLGNIVIHLMTEPARDFYELERLWSDGKMIRIGNGV
ncbi:MAG: ribosome silencing factor [Spirochaetaceae bacterium]|jgi:ribosome-associated protein|nr:ribosome silencing factor [Spirochaetaceae bacterium]